MAKVFGKMCKNKANSEKLSWLFHLNEQINRLKATFVAWNARYWVLKSIFLSVHNFFSSFFHFHSLISLWKFITFSYWPFAGSGHFMTPWRSLMELGHFVTFVTTFALTTCSMHVLWDTGDTVGADGLRWPPKGRASLTDYGNLRSGGRGLVQDVTGW